MRILWFSVTPSLFNPYSNNHNGGGWIASLEQIVRKETQIQLAVAFKFPDNHFRYDYQGVFYYPINIKPKSIVKRDNGKEALEKYLKIIEDFKPDLIQIFGSENDFGQIIRHTSIPVVIHMQGCLPPYHNALFPIGMNKYDFIFQKGLNFRYRIIGLRSEPSFYKRSETEIDIIQSCKYFMGRTDWDKGLINLFNPKAKYFHCEEALRDSFIQSNRQWKYEKRDKISVISVISRPWYKGVDLILKTAKLLQRFADINFEWKVYGVPEIHFFEHKYGIKASDVNVKVMGTASKEELVEALCEASCYVHSSYIDNSPNSLCEAQLIGVPVLATNVGGISSLVRDRETGILFPANDPYRLAYLIKSISSDVELAVSLGTRARNVALRRHNPDTIGDTLITIYKQIIANE